MLRRRLAALPLERRQTEPEDTRIPQQMSGPVPYNDP
jgi:hypothetical protein